MSNEQLDPAIIADLKAAGYLVADAGDECKCVPFDAGRVYHRAMEVACDHPGRPELQPRDPSQPWIQQVILKKVEWYWNDRFHARIYVGCCEMCKRIFFSSETPLDRLDVFLDSIPVRSFRTPEGIEVPNGLKELFDAHERNMDALESGDSVDESIYRPTS